DRHVLGVLNGQPAGADDVARDESACSIDVGQQQAPCPLGAIANVDRTEDPARDPEPAVEVRRGGRARAEVGKGVLGDGGGPAEDVLAVRTELEDEGEIIAVAADHASSEVDLSFEVAPDDELLVGAEGRADDVRVVEEAAVSA